MLKDHDITNQVTGQVIRFITTGSESNGALLEMESVFPCFSYEPPSHFHPVQEESFEVRAGELTVRINSEIRTFRAGERVMIKAGVCHSVWNAGSKDSLVCWKITPALETAEFLTILTSLANTGHGNGQGFPKFPLMIYLNKRYRDSFRLAGLNGAALTVLSLFLYPVFLLCNYKRIITDACYPSKLSIIK